MKFRNNLIIMLAAMMLVPVTSAAASPASKAKNKKKAKTEVVAQESKPAPKKKVSPYDKLMKDVKVSAKGETFSLYRTAKDKIYMELPKKYMGRRIMVGGTITAGSNPSFINVGYKYNKPQYFQIDLTDSLVSEPAGHERLYLRPADAGRALAQFHAENPPPHRRRRPE